MKRLMLSLAVLGMALGFSSPRVAEAAPKTVAVISLAGYDKLMSDVAFFGKLAEQPDVVGTIEGLLQFVTQGQGLAGLDKAKPWGVTVSMDDGAPMPSVLAFVPVTDAKKLLDALSGLTGEAEDAGDGVKKITKDRTTVFVKPVGGWAFISIAKEALGATPADPIKLLDGLESKYSVAARVYLQNVPAPLREMMFAQMDQGFKAGLRRQPGEDDAAFELRRGMVQAQMKSFTTAIKETESFTIGWAVDSSAGKRTFIDFAMTAAPGTNTAKQFAALSETTTNFAGFLNPAAAGSMNFSGVLDADQLAQATAALATVRTKALAEIDKDAGIPDDAAKKAVKDIVSEFLDAVQATLAAGKLDGGATLVLAPKSLKFVAGAQVADGAAFEAPLKKLVELAKNEPGFPGIKFDAEKHAGIRFHHMGVPVPDAKAAAVLGDTLDVYLGIGAKALYVALGKGSLDVAKTAIDASAANPGKTVPPMQLNISLTSFFAFAASVEPNPMVTMLADELAKSGGQDHVSLVARPITNGVTYRLEAEEGVLKTIAKAGKASAMSGGAGRR